MIANYVPCCPVRLFLELHLLIVLTLTLSITSKYIINIVTHTYYTHVYVIINLMHDPFSNFERTVVKICMKKMR